MRRIKDLKKGGGKNGEKEKKRVKGRGRVEEGGEELSTRGRKRWERWQKETVEEGGIKDGSKMEKEMVENGVIKDRKG